MKENWTYKKLSEIATFSRGLTFSKSVIADTSSKQVLRSNNIDLNNHSLNFDDVACLNEDFVIPDEKKLHKGDIFICMSNGSTQHLGKVAFIAEDMDYAFGGFMGAIHPNQSETNPKFVFYACLSSEYRRFLASVFNGVNINNLKWSDLSNYSIPVPPLEIQSRIVSELDLLQSIIDKQQAQLKELDKLAQAVFYDMFGDPVENERGWKMKTIKEIALVKIGPFGSLLHTSDYIKGGVPLVNPIHMKNGRIVPDESFTISKEKRKEMQPYLLKKGDVVFARRGEIGRCAIVSEREDGYLCGTGSLFVRFKETISELFVLYWTKSDSLVKDLISKAKGATMLNINCNIVENLQLPIPPLPLQQAFVEKIETIEHQKAIIKQSLVETQKLFDYTMDKYFG